MALATGEYAATNAVASAATGAAVDSIESDTPDITTQAYTRSLPRIRKCRDLMQGIEAIRAGGTLYLPQYPQESDSMYNARRTIAGLFNGFSRTVLAIVGFLLQEDPTLDKDMPQPLVDLAENVDGAGTHLAVFAKKLATAGVVDGFAGILTEYPRANDPRIDRSKASFAATVALDTGAELDAADVKALGLRPYFILVKADTVLLPLYETVNGKKTLVMLILKETATERKGRFGLKNVTRYRVYTLDNRVVRYERWTAAEGNPRPIRDEGPTVMRNLTDIPWSPLICGEELGTNEYKPTLLDLADLNITHHRIATGILSLEELAFVPTPVRVGAALNADGVYPPLVLGPGNTIEAPAVQGVTEPVYWLSPPVDVLAPGMQSLENCKAEMGAMGASFLTPQPVQETAAAKRMDSSAERATITTMSRALKDCLESAFGFAGQYINEKAGSVTLADEFTGESMDPQLLAVLVTAYQSDLLTLSEMRYIIKTGQLPETFDPDDKLIIQELLAQSAARMEQKSIDAALKGDGNAQPDLAA